MKQNHRNKDNTQKSNVTDKKDDYRQINTNRKTFGKTDKQTNVEREREMILW